MYCFVVLNDDLIAYECELCWQMQLEDMKKELELE